MFLKIDDFLNRHSGVGLLILRIFVGLRLVYGVIDNVFSDERMLEFVSFLEVHGFPFPGLCGVVSVYAQLLCGLCILLGFYTRLAALILIINFTIALWMIHLPDTVEGMTPALAMWSGSLCLLFTSAGRLSIGTLFHK